MIGMAFATKSGGSVCRTCFSKLYWICSVSFYQSKVGKVSHSWSVVADRNHHVCNRFYLDVRAPLSGIYKPSVSGDYFIVVN